ncbi:MULTISPECIES: rod-binding protein [Sphingobium]|uniref:rod-binding protein n=1 Tax=Sphingobium TaxID=165695 RepID=UPI0015EB4E88|nr:MULTISPECIES: rod-binding protein [Sphingobium]MCW2362070.1 flagellar protein FlgJ [Sphingobium sp. B10D3B]MCW2401251.1 flagellar protein FlgJ [Sphingobium sp. B10D7B]MCW2408231.1 flagellar protein FlgJ [Sphingobium xanthum]
MTQVSGIGSGQAALAAATQGAQAQAPTSPKANDDHAALQKAAKAFEAVFTRQLLSSMRQASLGEEIGGGSGLDQFREMQDAHMAEGLATKGGLGIAELILQQLDHKP